MNKQKLTHGEEYYKRKNEIDFKSDCGSITRGLSSLPDRMSRKGAIEYYGYKIRKYFAEVKAKKIIEQMQGEVYEDSDIRDFRSPEEYYHFHDTLNLIKGIYK